MKKNVFLMAVAIMLLSSTRFNLFAQSSFGVKFSGTLSKMYFEDTIKKSLVDYEPVIGYNIGITFEFPITERLKLGAEALFSKQGFKRTAVIWSERDPYSGESYFTNTSTTMTMYYYEMPIMLRYYIGNFSLEAGPQLSFCIGGEQETSGTGNGITINGTYKPQRIINTFQDLEDRQCFRYYNRLNIGAGLGVSYDFPIGLYVGVRYNFVFTDLFTTWDGKSEDVENIKSKNSVVAFSVGFKFKNLSQGFKNIFGSVK